VRGLAYIIWGRLLPDYFTCLASVSVILASTSSLFTHTLSLFISLALYFTRHEIEIFAPRSVALAPPSHSLVTNFSMKSILYLR
jgi:hypothetical protein